MAEWALPAGQGSPVTLQEPCMDWPTPAAFVLQTLESTGEAEHQGNTSGALRGSHRRTCITQDLGYEGIFSAPKMEDSEHVESMHRRTIKNDINFQEQIIATPNQSQTKYF